MALRRGTARRYAEAAFEIALRDDSPDAWLAVLALAEERLSDPQVSRLLQNPAIPFASRREIVEKLLGTEVQGAPRNLLLLLVQRGRADLIGGVVREFRRLHARRAGIVEATVTSALPLREDEVVALRQRLEDLTGSRFEMAFEVDPAILGGIQVRFGDRLIDGSVRGRLERLRNRLASGSI